MCTLSYSGNRKGTGSLLLLTLDNVLSLAYFLFNIYPDVEKGLGTIFDTLLGPKKVLVFLVLQQWETKHRWECCIVLIL